ncbi:rho GTPase-activating protein 26-like isoform X1 [Microplitis mediator]|uniref:rho GTPase-activating protein 26-like isoform X1 n=1 Tax=Microplitis mediator TaxID=375433 RepID=UPI0025554486|nr:rho GTPase-activating protein 26-like isoform X1 [Microplitis mediator]XP_057339825.1 rho GTPase-activating protein 26-like isoform X1 [Microplitis mediator]
MGIGLKPLEFTDCLTDSPFFRENLHYHERELDKTSQQIKRLIKEVKELLVAAKNLSRAQRAFSKTLQNFSFECIGETQTEDELHISQSLKEFGKLIASIEDERDRMLERAYDQIILPLENFRKEHIGGVKEGKKKFEKQTVKFCQSQERYLSLSTKKQDNVLQEADATLDMAERHFCQASLEYVFLLQEVQERKKFEFVETLLGFMFGWLTFYHQGHEVAKDFKPYMTELQLKIQKTRENFLATRDKTESLMNKMKDMKKSAVETGLSKLYSREGYLFLMEKKAFGAGWTKQYCTYQKNTKEFTMIPYNQLTGKFSNKETLILASCVRRMSDTIEKRFCFDITASDKPGIIYTFQALSEEDRKLWMDAMDGKEPTYAFQCSPAKSDETILDETGFLFVSKCINALENRGLEEQGLYRVVGVASKVNKLLSMGLDKRKLDKLNFDDKFEWESKTITSALKTYLRTLSEPIMTFRFYNSFIIAAKLESRESRIHDIHTLVYRLPKANFNILMLLIKHLCNIANKCDKNLMTVGNLAVCFGPTLLRPEEETVASIMDIKFYNIVVEILIENYERISAGPPHELTQPSHSLQKLTTISVEKRNLEETQGASGNGSALNKYNMHTVNPVLHSNHSKSFYEKPLSIVTKPVSVDDYNDFDEIKYGVQHLPSFSDTRISRPKLVNANFMYYSTDKVGSGNTSSSNESVASDSHLLMTDLPLKHKRGPVMGMHYPSGYSQRNSSAISFSNTSPASGQSSPGQTSGIWRVRTLYACMAENDGELSFEPNQIITNVRPSLEPGWLEGTLNGKTGLVPKNYVEQLP